MTTFVENLTLSLKRGVAASEISSKVNGIKLLELSEKKSILTQMNTEGLDVLILIALHAPDVLPTVVDLIKTLPDTAQTAIFERAHGYCLRQLVQRANPMLELIKILPDKLQINFFMQTDNIGENTLLRIIHKAPQAIPAALELIKKYPVLIQGEIFKSTEILENMPLSDNALTHIIGFNPEAISAALELIKEFPVAKLEEIFPAKDDKKPLVLYHLLFAFKISLATLEVIKKLPLARQEAIFKRVGMKGENWLQRVANETPLYLPMWLQLIKKFPEKIRDDIIKHKNDDGEGLEFYIVSTGDPTLLKTLWDMGFTFNREIKNKRGEGLLEKTVISCSNYNEMIKALISQYGLKPEPGNKLLNCLRVKLRVNEADALMYAPQFDATYLSNLYDSYVDSLQSFILTEAADLPRGNSQAADLQAIKVLEANVDKALRLRAELLQPLFDYCEQNNLDIEAKHLLQEVLLASKKLSPFALEVQLDGLLNEKEISEKAYIYSLIKCRLNTEKITKNKPNLSLECQKKLENRALELKKQSQSAAFQLNVLYACAAISATTFALGLVAVCSAHLMAVGIAVLTCSAIILGKSIYGLYARKETSGIHDAKDKLSSSPVLSQ